MSSSDPKRSRVLSIVSWFLPCIPLIAGCAIYYYYRYAVPAPAPLSSPSSAVSAVPDSLPAPRTPNGVSQGSIASHDLATDSFLDEVVKGIQEELDDGEEARLAEFELYLLQQLASGWEPPWRGLDIKETDDEIRKMSTKELGLRLWTTGIYARESIVFDRPSSAMKRLEVCYKGYAELFRRPDLWQAMVEAMSNSSLLLSPSNSDQANLNLAMVLTSLPSTYGYPPIRRNIAGHEKELIKSHIAALLRIKDFVVATSSQHARTTAPLFTPRTAIVLCESALTLGERLSAAEGRSAKELLQAFQWRDGRTGEDLPRYVDQAVPLLRRFVE